MQNDPRKRNRIARSLGGEGNRIVHSFGGNELKIIIDVRGGKQNLLIFRKFLAATSSSRSDDVTLSACLFVC